MVRRVLSREKLAVSVVGGRQKMTARHISPSEAKVAGADPIFVSGEAPAHIQQLSLPQFCPQICP